MLIKVKTLTGKEIEIDIEKTDKVCLCTFQIGLVKIEKKNFVENQQTVENFVYIYRLNASRNV